MKILGMKICACAQTLHNIHMREFVNSDQACEGVFTHAKAANRLPTCLAMLEASNP